MAGEWISIKEISYKLTRLSRDPWDHYHEWVKKKTADFQGLRSDVADASPFSEIPSLASCVKERLLGDQKTSSPKEGPACLRAIGTELCRIELDTEAETKRVRVLAQCLANTQWQTVPELEIVPYIREIPAGTGRRADVFWLDQILYICDLHEAKLSKAKRAKLVSEEIAKVFNIPEIKSALLYSFGKDPSDVSEYLEESFKLAPASTEIPSPTEVEPPSSTHPNDPQPWAIPFPSVEISPSDDTDEDKKVTEGESIPTDSGSYRPRNPKKRTNLRVIGLFAKLLGFKRVDTGRFENPDGSSITKRSNSKFWVHENGEGEIVRYYWPIKHCFDQYSSLVLEADIWGLIDRNPELYSLILQDREKKPFEMRGIHLIELTKQEKLKLYPESYRIQFG